MIWTKPSATKECYYAMLFLLQIKHLGRWYIGYFISYQAATRSTETAL